MLKKVYRKNGIIILMDKDTNDLREPYFIIQNYSKYKTLAELKKKLLPKYRVYLSFTL